MQQLGAIIKTAFVSDTWKGMGQTEKRLFAGLLLLHFLLCGWYISRLDFTTDETGYFGYAIRWASGHPERVLPVDDSKSPVVLPALLPTVFKPFIDTSKDAYGFVWLQAGRWMMYVYTALASLVMLLWLHRLWGPRMWLLPMLLFLFDPLVFGYSMIVGSDLPSAALLLASLYLAWRFSQTHSAKHWWWFCVCMSLAVVAKSSMLYAIPLVFALLLVHFWKRLFGDARVMLQALKRAAGFALVFLAVVNAAYYFHHSFFAWQDMPQRSAAFQGLVQRFSFLGSVPVPLPYDFVSSFDLLKHNAALGGGMAEENSFIGVVILGNLFARGPVWYYYIVSFLFKMPIVTILLLGMLVWMFVRHQGKAALLKQYLFVWAPALYFFVLLSVANPFQIGVRHALPVFPFLFIALSFPLLRLLQQKRKLLLWLLIFQMVSLFMFWPNLLAYTNELLWPKRTVYRYLYDSSVSYGHTQPYLKEFLQKHPDYRKPTAAPAAGRYAIDLEALANPYNSAGLAWLHRNFEPVGQYQHTIILFHISEEDLRKAGLKN